MPLDGHNISLTHYGFEFHIPFNLKGKRKQTYSLIAYT